MRIVSFYNTALLLITSASIQAATEPEPAIEIVDFKEQYSSTVNVSGGLLVGYQVESRAPYFTGKELYFSIPDGVKNVEMSISSIDGIYSANFQLKATKGESQWSRISIPSEYLTELQKYQPYELVVLAYVEVLTKGKKKRIQVFPTSWGEPLGRQTFYINTTSSFPSWISKNSSGEKIQGRCKKVDSIVHTAFNFACVIDNEFERGAVTPITFKAGRLQTHLVWTAE